MSPEQQLLAILALPWAGAVGIALARRHPNLREAISLLAALGLAALVWSLLPAVAAGARPALVLATLLPGVELRFAVEPLGMVFAALASLLWVPNTLYSIGYMRANREENQTRFYVLFAVALGATMGIALAGNLVTLFLCYELLTLSTYPLVAHKGDPGSRQSARSYLAILLATSIGLLLPAIVWTHAMAGTTDFAAGGVLPDGIGSGTVLALLALFAFGTGKAALMPVHRWLPAAMVAPTPVSALLHAVAVVKAGVFVMAKVVIYVLGTDALAVAGAGDALMYVAGFSVVAAGLSALRQGNLKRLLAYSTISQLSYVTLAAALLVPAAGVGAALHIAAHGVGKITLFFAAGSIYIAARQTETSQLDGIGRRMPWTMAAFSIGALSMIGLPPTAGFVSKWQILVAAFEAGRHFAVLVLAASTLLTAAYLLPIVYRAWFLPPPPTAAHGEAPATMVAALTLTAALTLLLFAFHPPVLEFAWLITDPTR